MAHRNRFGVLVAVVGVFLELLPPVAANAGPDAQAVLKELPSRGGVCAIVGDREAKLAIELARSSELLIYLQLGDPKDVPAARKAVDRAVLSRRIYVEQGSSTRLHLADNLADVLVVSGDANVPEKEAMRVVRPGGKVLMGSKATVKPAVEGLDDWTHPLHLPDNNPVSKDRATGAPYRTQFLVTPFYAPMPQATVASAGRAFKAFGGAVRHMQEIPWENRLVAFNGYNGSILWNRPLPSGFVFNLNTLIATPQALYICAGTSCNVLDAATGETKDKIVLGGEVGKDKVWKWMALEGGVLYAILGALEKKVPNQVRHAFRGGWEGHGRTGTLTEASGTAGGSATLCAVDPKTKKVLWTHQEEKPFDARATCMKNGRIFLLRWGDYLACVEGRNGKELWRKTGENDPELLQVFARDKKLMEMTRKGRPTSLSGGEYLVCNDDTVLFANTLGTLVALSTDTGEVRWQSKGVYEGKDPWEDKKLRLGRYVRTYPRFILRDDRLYALGRGRSNQYDLSTGVQGTKVILGGGCSILTGTRDGILWRAGGITMCTDWTSGRIKYILPMRPTCADGVTVAHGLLYWWPMVCGCPSISGTACLAPVGKDVIDAVVSAKPPVERLTEEGATVTPLPQSDQDWPTYRGNSARTARTETVIPEKVERLWDWPPPSPSQPTAPVAAGELVFTGGLDGAVRCIDAETGKLRWQARTGGEIRYPPTIWRGRTLVGSGDGWVYCLEAATGRRLWRLRLAPEERKIPVYDTLLSTWPVASGVLVEGGVAYAAAGLAGVDGTVVCAFDAANGTVKWRSCPTINYALASWGAPSYVGVQGALLLHKGELFLPGAGGTAVFNAADGKMKTYRRGGGRLGRGSELYLLDGRVVQTGPYLYERPDTPSFLAARSVPFGVTGYAKGSVLWLNPAGNTDVLCGLPKAPDLSKVKDHRALAKGLQSWIKSATWRYKCAGNTAVVGAPNAILAAIGRPLDKRRPGMDPGGYQIVALNPADGSVLWNQPLPAEPVRWGLAVDSRGRIIVTLRDGRVLCFGKKQG